MSRLTRLLLGPALALLLITGVLALLPMDQPALRLGSGQALAAGVEVHTLNTAPITSTTNFGGERWAAVGVDQPPTVAEIYLLVDLDDTAINTTTFTLQVSPDGVTWLDHGSASALATALVTDTNTYSRTTVDGIFYRIVATPSTTDTLTPTVKVVLR